MAGSAGIVLAGGRSSRMRSPKAALEWHGSTLLRRVTGVVMRAVDGPVIVVKAPGQELPAVSPDVVIHEDPREGLGPMQGLATGLAAIRERADTAFVCSTDLPFLHTAFVRAVMSEFGSAAGGEWVDVILPIVRGIRQPLLAGYRTSLLPKIEGLLAAGQLKLALLFDECRVACVDEGALLQNDVLADGDPTLDSVTNINEPAEYAAARALQAPEVLVEAFGVLASNGQTWARRIRAATLAEAAAGIGLTLNGHLVAALNGDQIPRDGEMPLVAGDRVSFISEEVGA